MSIYKLSVTIHYWPGSVEGPDKKTIEISQDHFANTHSAASLELDRILFNQRAELEREGFRMRHENWSVRQIEP